MRNKYKPFFYERKKTSPLRIFIAVILAAIFFTVSAWQVPRLRQRISEPVFALGSFLVNVAHDFLDSTRMYHVPESKPQSWPPLELPDKDVLFAESLENLSAIAQEDPLADLRQTPTPSEYSRVAEWEYLDPNMNYELNFGETTIRDVTKLQLSPPVFEHADLYNDGPAILSANLRFWGKVENQYRIADLIHPDALDPDCDFSELQLYIRSNYPDFSSIVRYNGDKDILVHLIQKGIPPIIRVKKSLSYSFWRKDDRFAACYLLILGYDSDSDSFFCQDTFSGNKKQIDTEILMSDWYPFQRTYFVLYPNENDADVREILAENYYEELNLQKAENKFRTDSSILENNAFAQYNYAVILHKTNDNTGAWDHFLKASEITLPQRYLFYQKEILETAMELGLADNMDMLINPAIRYNNHDEVLTTYSGWADILRSDFVQGAKKFEKAYKINPNSEFVQYALKYLETMNLR